VPLYAIEPRASRVVVAARSNIHDTSARWDAVSGTIEADPDDLTGAGCAVDLWVDMTRHDAGDFLRNRKLRKDLQVERFPRAHFSLTALEGVEARGEGRFAAQATGVIDWHDRQVTITASGEGTLGPAELSATARFELDVRAFGVEPPRFLMFKVEEIVAVEVTLSARVAPR
jgi:polyisoprenoid-binding protein YceI